MGLAQQALEVAPVKRRALRNCLHTLLIRDFWTFSEIAQKLSLTGDRWKYNNWGQWKI